MGENEMKSLLLASTAGLLLLSDAAIAQTGTAQGSATPDKNAERSNDDTIVVTATRREERLQDVPLSVTAYRQRSEEHTSELQSRENLVCRLLLEKKKTRSTPPDKRDGHTRRGG